MPGTLYIVATPIGNLDDITLRALETLKKVDLILCEDTRVTKKLLDHFDIQVNTLSYQQHSSDSKKRQIQKLLIEGKNIALVTDAGTPGISDPGNELISFLEGVKIIPVPGASSITASLSVCGFDVNKFMFIGFWPKKKAGKLITNIETIKMPIVFFESPYRVLKTLTLLEDKFHDAQIFVGQELTKLHERVLKGTIADVKTELEKEKKNLGRVKGEIVIVLKL